MKTGQFFKTGMASLLAMATMSSASLASDDEDRVASDETTPQATIERRTIIRSTPVQTSRGLERTEETREDALSAAWMDRPDLFGTRARPADAADADWIHAVRQDRRDFGACLRSGTCGTHTAEWQSLIAQAREENRFSQLQRVNTAVNERLAYRSDIVQYNRSDVWMSPETFLSASAGDCEDYALGKLWLLSEIGIAPEDMYVMVVRDNIARAPHAFLAVRMGPSFVILDSRTNRILLPEDLSGIVPVITVGASESFVHRRSLQSMSQPVRVASSHNTDLTSR